MSPDRRPRGCHRGGTRSKTEFVDDVAVERAMAGDQVELNVTERETAVLQLRQRGLNDQQIARRLHMSDRTVLRIRRRLQLPAVA